MYARSLESDAARVCQQPESQCGQRGGRDRWAAIDNGRDEEKCSQPVKNKANPHKHKLHMSLSS
jgi:hypothetical protein